MSQEELEQAWHDLIEHKKTLDPRTYGGIARKREYIRWLEQERDKRLAEYDEEDNNG